MLDRTYQSSSSSCVSLSLSLSLSLHTFPSYYDIFACSLVYKYSSSASPFTSLTSLPSPFHRPSWEKFGDPTETLNKILRKVVNLVLIPSNEMGVALSKFWGWRRDSVREQPYLETFSSSSSSSSSSFRSCYDLEQPHSEAAQTHDPSPSSSSTFPSDYDVFLSFSGEDTYKTFTGHLYTGLDQPGISAFMANEELKEGYAIWPALKKAIEGSRISIPIFSVNYASSKWCLNELVQIMESRATKAQLVWPIFFHVEPSDVRNQSGVFGQRFHKLAISFDEGVVDKWKRALKEAGELKGWDLKNIENGNESKLIQLVVEKVWCELRDTSCNSPENLVGINSRVKELLNLLNLESRDVRIVGIWGMGGIGKSTVAEAVFNQICDRFVGSVFLEDIRERASKDAKGLVGLQEQLLSSILKREIQSISNKNQGKNLIKKYLHAKVVLIVLDDVDSTEQLEALAGQADWFGLGSRIIITSRDEFVLNRHRVHEIYEAKELEFDQSLCLFNMHAFGKDQPVDDFLKLSRDLVHIAGGLPLALKVLGSLLFGERNLEIWECTLGRLKKIPNKDIQEKLQISYEGLDRLDKKIFLDIACFFIGTDKEYATYIWEGCGFFPKLGIQKLIRRSLVKIDSFNKLRMHDQLRDMGRDIVCQESLDRPWECSRLWSHEEVVYVLRSKKGTEKVKGIILKFGGEETALDDNCFSTKEFKPMSELRLLQIYNVRLLGDLKYLPSELRWFSWKCLLESMPEDFCLEKLVALDLSHSRIQVWNDLDQKKEFRELKVLILSGCKHITKIPNLLRFPKLEQLNLEGCKELRELPPSICKCKSLKKLILSECSNLCKLPDLLGSLEELEVLNLQGCELISRLPDSVGNMRNLKTLTLDRAGITEVTDAVGLLEKVEILSARRCSNLVRLPNSVGKMRNLRGFFIGGTCIVKLPEDFGMLSCLSELNLAGCVQLRELPHGVRNLKSLTKLILSGCSNLYKFPKFSRFPNLENLNLERCVELKEFPPSIYNLKSLKNLTLSGCSNLCKLPDLSRFPNLERLNVEGCIGLRELPPGICNLKSLKVLILSGCSNLKELPNLLGSQELEVLKFDGCKLLCRAPDLIENTRNLKTLVLDGTSITELPNAVGLMEKMEILSVKHCSNLVKLPDSMGKMRLLKEFFMVETGIVNLPEDFGMLSSLKKLYMSNCREFICFPESFGSLVKLSDLNVEGNSKLAVLPNSFSGLSSLERLYASRCNFSEGGIPSDFGKLLSLKRLDLSYNNFISLPASISALSHLWDLNLSNCRNLQYLRAMPSCSIWLNVENCMSLASLPDLKSVELVDLSKGIKDVKLLCHLRMTGCSRALLNSVKKCLGQQQLPAFWTFTGSEIPDDFIPMKVSYGPGPSFIGDVFRLDCEEEVATTSVDHQTISGVVLCFVFTFLKEPPPDAEFEIAGQNHLNGGPSCTISRNIRFISERHQYQTCLYFWENYYCFLEVVEELVQVSFMIKPVPRRDVGGYDYREFEESEQIMEVSKAGIRVVYAEMEHPNIETIMMDDEVDSDDDAVGVESN